MIENSKKILIISNYADKLHIMRKELIKDLIERNYNVILAGSELKDGINVDYFSESIISQFLPISRFNINPLKEIKVLLSIKKILKNIKPDIVLVYGIKIIPSCVIGSRMAGINCVFSYINGAGSLFIKDSLKIRCLRLVAFPMIKLSLSLSTKVFFQNNDDILEFINKKLLKKNKGIVVNGSGVNMSEYPPTKVKGKTTFSIIGRLSVEKGIQEFIKAAEIVKSRYPNVNFIVAGKLESESLGEMLNKAINENIISYLGEIQNSNEVLNDTTVFVLPSYREGLPRVNLEAMSKKRALITTDTIGCRDTVIDGYNGFLVPIKNVDLIVERMIEFINDSSLAIRMGENGYKLCKEKFEVNKVNSFLIKKMCKE
ncbi:glycosyltransferase family 4 protein [[Eubacterium] hominis]|uniref:glycosyltransferase family 4 protein n=1 Tax=[Eubacterium] hominis TaxID=2764325 RepID=UPI003A4DBCA9